MLRATFWALLAWPLPALVAGALGWKGVWGSGSALVDYLIPIPVAGGVLHVPSFVICGLVVMAMPAAGDSAAGRMRAFLVGMALAGILMLLRLDDLWLAMQTKSARVGSLWQDNPLGVFVLSDALMALAFTALASQRPWLRLEIAQRTALSRSWSIVLSGRYEHAYDVARDEPANGRVRALRSASNDAE